MIKDKEYFRGNMYIIVGSYVLYLAYKLITELDMVKESSPILPWFFIVAFLVAGVGLIYIGGKALIKHSKAIKATANDVGPISLDFLDEDDDSTSADSLESEALTGSAEPVDVETIESPVSSIDKKDLETPIDIKEEDKIK